MHNTLEYANHLNVVKSKISELDNLLSKDFGFKLNTVLESYSSLFNRFCPFSVGDRVQLKEDINPPKDDGWYSSRHFLVKSAIATVRACDYRNDLFFFGLEFDDESWIDREGNVKPVTSKHIYYLSENKIERVSIPPDPCDALPYRVSKQHLDNGEVVFAIRKFYGNCNAWSHEEITPKSNSLDGLKTEVSLMMFALEQDVIDIGNERNGVGDPPEWEALINESIKTLNFLRTDTEFAKLTDIQKVATVKGFLNNLGECDE